MLFLALQLLLGCFSAGGAGQLGTILQETTTFSIGAQFCISPRSSVLTMFLALLQRPVVIPVHLLVMSFITALSCATVPGIFETFPVELQPYA